LRGETPNATFRAALRTKQVFMSLDKDTVRNIAFLARIKIPDEELDHLAQELSGIIGWVEQLNEVDTESVEPITSVADMSLYRRKDVVTDGGYQARVLANAPDPEAGCYTVPKVVE
jgi:aspartyl-tRNA(Asn)/glutamyl-tRNA(Gln) amidotransferase subunit C